MQESKGHSEQIVLVVLNIFGKTAKSLRDYLSLGAEISSPDPSYAIGLQLFERTRLAGSVIWINAQGLKPEELVNLQKEWLPIAGKAIVLMGSDDLAVVNLSLHMLMAARRENPAFNAVVLTHIDTTASVTARLIASQSVGWLQHVVKTPHQPQIGIDKAMEALGLQDAPAAIKPSPSDASPLAATEPQITELPSQTTPALESPLRSVSATHLPVSQPPHKEGNSTMSTPNESMAACMQIDGAMAAALVDFGSGMALAKIGSGVNLDMAAAGNTEVLRAKMKTMAGLGIKGTIEDVLITLDVQYHLIRPIPHKPGLFLYLVLDKVKGNLAMARYKLTDIEKNITV